MSSCASKPPDIKVCGFLTEGRGFCSTMFSKKDEILDRRHWLGLRSRSVVLPMKDFSKLKKYYLKFCKRGKNKKKKC